MRTERWTCQENQNTEVHYFVEGEANTYVCGFNENLLGREFCVTLRQEIEQRLQCLSHSPWSFTKR